MFCITFPSSGEQKNCWGKSNNQMGLGQSRPLPEPLIFNRHVFFMMLIKCLRGLFNIIHVIQATHSIFSVRPGAWHCALTSCFHPDVVKVTNSPHFFHKIWQISWGLNIFSPMCLVMMHRPTYQNIPKHLLRLNEPLLTWKKKTQHHLLCTCQTCLFTHFWLTDLLTNCHASASKC